MRVAIALDQALAARDLDRERRVDRRDGAELGQPVLDARVLQRVAQRRAAPAPHRGHGGEHQVAAQRARLDHAPARGQALDPAPRRARGQQPAPERRGQGLGDLLQARVQVLLDREHLVGAGADLAAHAGEARVARLQVGHADRVLPAHPQREVARRLAHERGGDGGLGRPGRVAHCVQAVEVERPVGRVLVVHSAAQALKHEAPGVGVCAVGLNGPLQQRLDGGVGRARQARRRRGAGLDGPGRGRRAVSGLRGAPVGRGEGAQACLDAHPTLLNRRLELRARERQFASGGEGTEQHRADHAARFLGRLSHVEADEAPRRAARQVQQGATVGATIAHRGLLGDGVDAVGGGQQRGAPGRHEAALHRPAGLHQL